MKKLIIGWLDTKKEIWYRHAFPYNSKCDVVINNLTESLNNTLLVVRNKQILNDVRMLSNEKIHYKKMKGDATY